jgi:hypothetical protein
MRFPAVAALLLLAFCAAFAAGCGGASGGVFKKQYEYEEELYLSLDGSATLAVNASVPALVALRGFDLPVDPRARIDRNKVRALFDGPGVQVTRVSLSRRDGRRFVHLGMDVSDVRQLSRVAPFAWSSYRFDRNGDEMDFTQVVGKAAGKPVGDVGWTGRELVAFRMHIPSRIPWHNATDHTVQRGNIVAWEQPLSERLQGVPLDIEVHMEPKSILYSTLLLFGATIVAAALMFAVILWWVVKRGGRESEVATSRP